MAALAVRMVVSLAVVVGLLLLTTRVAGRRYRGRAGSTVQVLHRQPLSRGSTVTVVSVGGRVLVLGATEHQVRVLTELDPDDLEADARGDEPGEPREPGEPGEPAVGRRTAVAALRSVRSVVPPPVAVPAPVSPYADFAAALQQELGAAAGAPSPVRPSTVSVAAAAGRHRAAARATRTPEVRPTRPRAGAGRDAGPLAGSLLSPQTWREALQALSGRAS